MYVYVHVPFAINPIFSISVHELSRSNPAHGLVFRPRDAWAYAGPNVKAAAQFLKQPPPSGAVSSYRHLLDQIKPRVSLCFFFRLLQNPTTGPEAGTFGLLSAAPAVAVPCWYGSESFMRFSIFLDLLDSWRTAIDYLILYPMDWDVFCDCGRFFF